MAMPIIGMKQIRIGGKVWVPTATSRAASETAMLCVGPGAGQRHDDDVADVQGVRP